MANELRVLGRMNFSKGGATLDKSRNATLTVSGGKTVSMVQNIGTTDETLVKGDIGTIGFVMFKNLDSTNYIEIGSDGTNYPIRLLALEPAGPFRFNGTVHAKANTAACDLQYDMVEA